MVTLADSHVHLDVAAFEHDRASVIERARAAGVDIMVIPAVEAAGWPHLKALCEGHSRLYPAYGLHPMFLDRHRAGHIQQLTTFLEDHPAVAIGEIGLDFHQPELDPQLQREYFQRQLLLARERDLPVIVHARQALEEVTLTLRRTGGLRGVVHSFSGSLEQARQLWKLGFHIGIGGPVTYDRAQRLRRIVTQMPIEFLLLESDAPDQPDAGHRGERNEPARVVDVLRCVAALRHESEADVAAATTANTRRLFGLEQGH